MADNKIYRLNFEIIDQETKEKISLVFAVDYGVYHGTLDLVKWMGEFLYEQRESK